MPNPAPQATFTPMEVPRQARQQYDALLDRLTGLPGWALLLDRTGVALARAGRRQMHVGAIVFDDVRSALETGSDFSGFVQLLRKRLRGDDTVARVSGRTFVVVLNDISERSVASRIAQRLVWDAAISCRLGIAFDEPYDDATTLIDRALQSAVSFG
jgi:GGDEF domain-containing protein